MTKRAAARRARRKLTAHDQGLNRHHKGLSWMEKANRLAAKRQVSVPRKIRPPVDVYRSIGCARCGAWPGQPCASKSGRVMTEVVHKERRMVYEQVVGGC